MSPVTPPPSASERRRFLKLVGVAGLTTAVHGSLTGWATAATAPAAGRPAAAPSPPKPDSAQAPPPVPAEISEDARSFTAVVERRYGKFLSPKQLEAVTRELENRIQAGKRLRESKLANHDEPDVVFSA